MAKSKPFFFRDWKFFYRLSILINHDKTHQLSRFELLVNEEEDVGATKATCTQFAGYDTDKVEVN